MSASLSLLLLFALMVALIRLKVDIGTALLVGAGGIALRFGVDWAAFPEGAAGAAKEAAANFGRAAIAPRSLQLVGLILLITFLGHALRHAASLQRLIGALKALLRDRRAAMAVAPAFVGLLPMPGGALFSAPMVGELTSDVDVPREDQVLINFWFRHVWEWTWPLYPGLLFASQILDAPLETLILAQAPLTAAAILIGAGVCFRRLRMPAEARRRPRPARDWRELAASVWPVALVVVLTASLGAAERLGANLGFSTKTALLVALAVVDPLFLALQRVPWRQVASLVRRTLQVRLIVLVYGVLAFGYMLAEYGAADAVSREFTGWGVPAPLLLFSVPFVVGMLTGYQPGVVGTCFPLLASLIAVGGGVDYGRAAFAYAGGLCGVLLSPVHLCLVLSREYFEAEFRRVYRRLVVMVGLLAAAALGLLFLWGAVGLG
ncbi:MAG: DUF401 family protein [Candidatus Brocadiia bacterium]